MSKKAVFLGLAAAGVAAFACNRIIHRAVEDDFDPDLYHREDEEEDSEPILNLLKKAIDASDEDLSHMASTLLTLGIESAKEFVDTSNAEQERYFLEFGNECLDIYIGHRKGHAFIRKIEDSDGNVIMREIRMGA